MEFLLFDEDGVDLYDVSGTGTYPQPNNDSRYDLNKIRQVDIALSFRSGRDFYKSKPKGDLKRFIKTLRKDRNTANKGYVDKYLRESVVVKCIYKEHWCTIKIKKIKGFALVLSIVLLLVMSLMSGFLSSNYFK